MEIREEDLTLPQIESFESDIVWRVILGIIAERIKLISSELETGMTKDGDAIRFMQLDEFRFRNGELMDLKWVRDITSVLKIKLTNNKGEQDDEQTEE